MSLNKVSLIQIWNELFKYKISIIVSSVALFAIAVVITLQMPNKYKAKATVVAVSMEKGGLASLAKNFGGLAGIAGINLEQANGNDKSQIAMEVIKSPHFINKFVNKHQLTVPLMASIGSKPITYELILDEELYNSQLNTWVREVKKPKTAEPTPEEIYEKFIEFLQVEQDAKTGFIRISFEFYSPNLAKEWVELLIKDVNEVIKLDDKEEAQRSILFLNSALNDTSNASIKSTFYQLLEEQTKTLMLVEAKDEYVFKTISPALLPEKKSTPRRAVLCIASAFLGGFLSSLVVLVRYFSRFE